jgi:hypothetical protein
VAINPTKQLGETRNAQRRADVSTIIKAVYQYYIDTGNLPANITTNAVCDNTPAKQLCKSTATGTCSTGTDASVVTASEKYLTAFPTDPSGVSANGTGYYIVKSANSRVTVCAPSAEQSATISATN